jgi:hypothetical protein
MSCQQLEQEIPNLKGTGYDKYPISPQTRGQRGYNCIAFAAGDDAHRWWPHPNRFSFFWPPHLPRQLPGTETVDNFVLAFEWRGYRECKRGDFKKGIEKVAIFTKNERPTHAARQLESGVWTSKCGNLEDIQHKSLIQVEGDLYGKVHTFMHRRRDGKPFWKHRILAVLQRFKKAF